MLPFLFFLFLFLLFIRNLDLFVPFSQITRFVLLDSIFLSLDFAPSLLVCKVLPLDFFVALPDLFRESDLVLFLTGHDLRFRLLQVYLLFELVLLDLLHAFGFENDLGQLSAALDILAIQRYSKADCHIVHGELLPVPLRESFQVVTPFFKTLSRILLGYIEGRPLLHARRTLNGAESVGELHCFLLRKRLGCRRGGVGILKIQPETQLPLRHASRVRLDLQLLLLGLYRVRDSDPGRSVAFEVP